MSLNYHSLQKLKKIYSLSVSENKKDSKMKNENDNNELNVMQQAVLSLIRKGYENKVNMKYIAKILGITVRSVGYVLNELREFYPVCSTTLDGGGVWIADNNKDILTFIKHLEKLRNQHQLNINNMERHIK